jgi:hypothetical protein
MLNPGLTDPGLDVFATNCVITSIYGDKVEAGKGLFVVSGADSLPVTDLQEYAGRPLVQVDV